MGVRLYSLLFLPLLFLFFVWVGISYQLQKPIHRIYGWAWYICQWLPEIWQLVGGSLLWTSNCILVMQSIVKNLSIRETYLFLQFWSKSDWRIVFFKWCSLVFSSLPTLSFFPFLCLGCHQLSAAETHTKNIHRIWMKMIHLSIQWLPKIWQLVRGPLCELQIALL